MLHRMLAPTNVAYQTRTVNGRTYTGVPGTPQNIPDFDALLLSSNGWTFMSLAGPTAGRPSGSLGKDAAAKDLKYYDTDLSSMVTFDGQLWRDTAGSAV